MATWWLIQKSTEEKIMHYSDAEKNFATLTDNDYEFLEVPTGVLPGNCKVQDNAGTLELVEDLNYKEGPMWKSLRADRNVKLAQSDWTQILDAALTTQQVTDWATYRQELRDLPSTTSDPENPAWPAEPT